ncbi:MAG: HAMP domain-containing sensor histidine kinase [Candidatus Binatia bacterium]|nr:HAMP domain-containing sensor histidine kinase [Candidatus Binatia bacterium]
MRRRSLIFRYTLLHATLFILVLSGALAFLYWSTLSAHETEMDAQIQHDAQNLHDQLASVRTVTEMAAIVSRTTAEQPGRTTVYMLATKTRQYVAGNLREWPNGIEKDGDLFEFPLEGAATSKARGRGRTYSLPNGEQLLVGRNVSERARFRTLIGNAFGGALFLTVLLGVSGAYLLSRRVSRHLDEINQNSEEILQGNLELRMPETGRGDEFDELSQNLNRMLDRIGTLMSAMREVTDDIAHDMRSPISRLRSRIEVALLGKDDPAAYRAALEGTIEDADAILGMFNALLTIAHAESGEPRKNFEPVDVRKIVSDAVEIYEPAAEDAGLSVVMEKSPPARLSGNPNLLGQAITNLLDNAMKYVPTGGHLRCRVENADDRVRIVVADDGPGVPDAFFDKAFDRFSRLEASRTSTGSGLGLSLVRAIAHLHGGDVRLSAANPGLVVTIDLPVRSEA